MKCCCCLEETLFFIECVIEIKSESSGELRADHESNAVHVDLRPLTHQQAGGSRLGDNFCALGLLKKVAQDVGHHFVHRRGHLVPRGLLPDRDLGLPDGDLDLVLKGLDPLAQDVEAYIS